MTNIAATRKYGKHLENSSSQESTGRWPCNLVCSIMYARWFKYDLGLILTQFTPVKSISKAFVWKNLYNFQSYFYKFSYKIWFKWEKTRFSFEIWVTFGQSQSQSVTLFWTWRYLKLFTTYGKEALNTLKSRTDWPIDLRLSMLHWVLE